MRKLVPWMKRAETLSECVVSLNNGPLNNENFDMFYTPFKSPCREDKITRLIFKLQSLHDSYKFILAGHRGVGKSTELLRVSRKCTEYETIFVDASEAMGPKGTGYTNLLLLIANKVMEFGMNGGYLDADDTSFVKLRNYWNSELEISEVSRESDEQEKAISVDASINGEATSAFSFLHMLKTKIVANAKISSIIGSKQGRNITVDEIVHTVIDKDDLAFVSLLNQMLYNIQKSLGSKKKLLIVVQELDKTAQFAMAADVFDEHLRAFVGINSDMIFTFPVHLLYDPKYSAIHTVFDGVFKLGVVEILDNKGKYEKNAINAIKELMYKRISRDLIEDEALEYAIRMSGGLLRDIFSAVSDAAVTAAIDGRSIITFSDVRKAIVSMEDAYTKIPGVDNMYDKVVAININPYNSMTSDLRVLLSAEAILEYSGGRYMVHPILIEFLKRTGRQVKDYE